MQHQNNQTINKPTLRLLVPAIVALTLWMGLDILYDLLDVLIDDKATYRFMAAGVWVMLVISVGFSSLAVYTLLYFRGLSFKWRILGASMVPLAWTLKEFIRVSAAVTMGETIFFIFFTSVQVMLYIGQAGLMGISEMLCRWRDNRKGQEKRIFTAGPVAAVGTAVTALYFIMIKNGGYDYHLAVKSLYRYLFL